MTAPKSLQWRLSLWLGLAIALVWALAAAVTAQNLRPEMEEVFAEEAGTLLESAAEELDGNYRVDRSGRAGISLSGMTA